MTTMHGLQAETLFRRGEWTYRIPALLFLPQSGTMLAFAEERRDEIDEHAKRIVLRRGTYSKADSLFQWLACETLVTAQVEGHRSMNPSPVYDEVSQTIFLFFMTIPGEVPEDHQIDTHTNLARMYHVTSRDQGKTWSPCTDLTDTVIGSAYREWATFAVGPGHCLQLNDEPRTLVITAYAYRIHSPEDRPVPYAFCIYSSDHGETWLRGGYVGSTSTVECQVAEVAHSGGKPVLFCNARSDQGARVLSVSYTQGVDFADGKMVERLVEEPRGCHGSIVSFTLPEGISSGNCSTWVLFCHPTDPHKRRNLGLYLNKNPLQLEQWEEPVILFQGPSAYSDLQYLGQGPDDSPLFCCLFECGEESEYERVDFLTFTLRQICPWLY